MQSFPPEASTALRSDALHRFRTAKSVDRTHFYGDFHNIDIERLGQSRGSRVAASESKHADCDQAWSLNPRDDLVQAPPAGTIYARRPPAKRTNLFGRDPCFPPLLRSCKLKNKIALEEHFAIDLTIDQSKLYSKPVVWEMLKANLLDIEQQRLERMEQGGTAFSILSLNSPGTQGIPNVKEAVDVSRRANDVLAEHV